MSKTMIGTVTSDRADKTIVVTLRIRKTHPLYKKQYTITKRFMAHDEKNEAHVGDRVAIIETRPRSVRKAFSLHQIIERHGGGFRDDDATADVLEVVAKKVVEPKKHNAGKIETPKEPDK